ncbi:MAG: energy-coupling factor ABC transporter ATP-binding protein [Dethiosulfovibrio peptidovorans]|nr:MAG: energy-coupling factor ABC transporter ATP-binding protein [Dethiosulfovibrio peptidovorans]
MSISVQSVSHIYHKGTPLETVALREISLDIAESAWVSIVGHTGSGKSTLAQHLNALLLPNEGDVVVDGLSTSDKQDRRAIRRKVGLVFQYPEQQLFAETVREELAFAPNNWGIDPRELDTVLPLILDQVGLSPSYLDRSPFRLSGGEKRRVAIASVLTVRPSYLVLDEPTAGLDASGKRHLMELLGRIHREGTAIVMVTHDLELALDLSDWVVALEKGAIACQGSPESVARSLDRSPIDGLLLPELGRLWLRLTEAGFSVPFSCDPQVLSESLMQRRSPR